MTNENLTWADFGRNDLLKPEHEIGEIDLLFEKIEDDVIDFQINKLQKTREQNTLSK